MKQRPPDRFGGDPASSIRGKLILLGFLLFAVLSATGGILYQRSRAAPPLEFYGTTAAQRILIAPRVNIARLILAEGDKADANNAEADRLTIAGKSYRVDERHDITKTRGLVNIRYALLDRGTYDWETAANCYPQWAYVLEFVEPAGTTWLALSFDCPRLTSDGSSIVSIAPSARPIHSFVDEQFLGQQPATSPRP